MKKQDLYDAVLAHFAATMPPTETELHFDSPFELLVAVVLSAQCTDRRINEVTPRLFRDFPTPEAMAATTPEVIYDYIRSVSYPNNKARDGRRQTSSLPLSLAKPPLRSTRTCSASATGWASSRRGAGRRSASSRNCAATSPRHKWPPPTSGCSITGAIPARLARPGAATAHCGGSVATGSGGMRPVRRARRQGETKIKRFTTYNVRLLFVHLPRQDEEKRNSI